MSTFVLAIVTLLILFLLSRSHNFSNHHIHRRLRSNSTLSTADEEFNVSNKIVRLFPEIDVDPTDWFVSLHELTQWNLQQAQREFLHRSQREMDIHDKNHDGFVSFSEYASPTWLHNTGFSFSIFILFFQFGLL